jgi:phytoene dehydrogenase-like protein
VNTRSAYIVGSGPNGLTAGIVLARAGIATTVLEAEASIGGAVRSAQLTLPGFVHDVCSAVHPMAAGSPVFAGLPLAKHGLQWIHPAAPLAHPLDDGSAAMLHRSLDDTVRGLGQDGPAWRRAIGPLERDWTALAADLLGPLRVPEHPLPYARYAMLAPWPAASAARLLFRTPAARALFAGLAAHAVLPLSAPLSSAIPWLLAIAAHAVGWPIPRGGSQSLANALGSHFESLGGRIFTNAPVRSLNELRDANMILLDTSPRQLLEIAGSDLPAGYARKLERYRYGPGVFKTDFALSGPIPWKAPQVSQAATVHLGGTLEEISASEKAPWEGRIHSRPFVLLVQPSLFDPARAPAGYHTAWAYCHVPNGSTADASALIESQIERFAPGFRSRILARSVRNCADLQRRNANLRGGDITGGAQTLSQFFLRPTASLYRTPVSGLYLCSASTPPGGGVHGMCGYHAARCALEDHAHPSALQ